MYDNEEFTDEFKEEFQDKLNETDNDQKLALMILGFWEMYKKNGYSFEGLL